MGLAPMLRGLAHFCSGVALSSARSGFTAPAVAGNSRLRSSPARPCGRRRMLAGPRTLQVSSRIAADAGAGPDPKPNCPKRSGEGIHSGCAGAGGIVGHHLRMVGLPRLSKISAASEGAAIRRNCSPSHGEPSRIGLLLPSLRPIHRDRCSVINPFRSRVDQGVAGLEKGRRVRSRLCQHSGVRAAGQLSPQPARSQPSALADCAATKPLVEANAAHFGRLRTG